MVSESFSLGRGEKKTVDGSTERKVATHSSGHSEARIILEKLYVKRPRLMNRENRLREHKFVRLSFHWSSILEAGRAVQLLLDQVLAG